MLNSFANGVPFPSEGVTVVQRYMPGILLWQVSPYPIEAILCTYSFTTKKPLACTGQSHKHLTPEVDLQFVATNPASLVQLGIVVGLPRPC